MDPTSPGFQQEFLADIERVPPLQVHMSAGAALALIGQVQLALRHPMNSGPSAVQARSIVEQLINAIAVTPTLRRGLDAGWQPEHDHRPLQREYPKGRIAPDDDGVLAAALEVDRRHKRIILRFHHATTWVGMTADEAQGLRERLEALIEELA